jgi:GT2 family glycosyltransferase
VPPEPRISVVVATHNRAHLLPRLVDALAGQAGAEPFEAVIVDDGSSDDTSRELQRLASEAPFPLRPLRLEHNVGAAAARNAGWRAGRAPLVAFTDDDCVPQPGWLAALSTALSDHDAVQGQTRPDPAQRHKLGPFARTIDVTWERGFYETCNMGYRRVALERSGGFDERFRRPYGEDCDLAWRVKDAGGQSTFAPDALVHHDIWPSDYRAYLRDKRRHGGIVLAVKNHPALRARRGLFQNGTHPSAVLAVAGGTLFLVRPGAVTLATAAAAGAAYTWNCRLYHAGPRRKVYWLAILPLNLVADLYEVAVLARASVRYRTNVL